MNKGRVVMGLLFYPRGGSAYVVRYLSPALGRSGWSVSLAAGSLGGAGDETHAPTFFDGLEIATLDYTDAAHAFAAGGDAIAAPVPMQPSYEDRPDVPDVVLASVRPDLAEHLSAVWQAPMRAAGADHARVFHLHHLTPQLDASRQWWPHVPLVVHLHGTELKLIEAVAARVAVATLLGETLATMPAAGSDMAAEGVRHGLDETQSELLRTTRWGSWRHGEFWSANLKRQAGLADHIITVSSENRDAAVATLGADPSRVTAIPNGVDIERFGPQSHTAESRRATFRHALVEDPQGWSEDRPPGALTYTDADLDRLLGPDGDGTVLVFVGRFLAFKRVPALVRAFAAARARFTRPASLLIWGGHPGEWEGEHPATVAGEVGAEGIYFAGWRGHDDLPRGLAACDALIVPSVDDPFPQVPLEAMAVGLPVLACRSGGLAAVVNADAANPTGWFVPPDDPAALADMIARVVNDPEEVRSRGANALAFARADLSWDGRVPAFEAAYEQGTDHHRWRRTRGIELPAA
jgi:glycosyltransferase involved in cell wall biosynthesis